MKEIVCFDCGFPVRLTDSTHAQMEAHATKSSLGIPWLNYLCPHCKHLQFAQVRDRRGTISESRHTFFYLVWLECSGGCTPSRISVAVQVHSGTHVKDVRDDVKHWKISDAMCPDQHAPSIPLEVSSSMGISSFL